MAYSDKVIDHYENPRNVGSFDKGDDAVGTGMVGAPACGDVMKLQIKVGDDGRHRGRALQDLRLRLGHRLELARHRVGEGQDARPGRPTIKNTQIAEELSLPPVKIHCSILAEDAIKAAVADYKKKHAVEPEDRKRWPDGRHAHRKRRDARPALPRQARQGRRPAPGRAHHRLLGHGLQARVRRRRSSPRT